MNVGADADALLRRSRAVERERGRESERERFRGRSKLYVDGTLVVDDDGLHGMVERCVGSRPPPHPRVCLLSPLSLLSIYLSIYPALLSPPLGPAGL